MPDLKISPELALLMEAALEGKSKPPFDSYQREINWAKLSRLANWHQVRPLLLDHLQNRGEKLEVPAKHLAGLKEFAMGQAVTNMAFLGISVRLYEQLDAVRVKAFLMKGALWAWLLYEKPNQREFGDIDFFIEEGDINKSLSTLKVNGFEPDPYRKYLMGQDALRSAYLETDYQLPLQPIESHALQSLEIQWKPSYPRYCYDLNWKELSLNMISVNMAGSLIQIPNMENQLLMMVIHHGGVEQWDKLKYMADFVRILRKHSDKLDWSYIQDISGKQGFKRLLSESVGMVRLLTGEAFGGEAFESAMASPSDKFRSAILKHWENERPVLKSKSWRIFLYNMRHRDNLGVKFSIILAHLSYLTNLRLLWHKALWYKKHQS
ncbi:nucleotidyltransferase family protein [Dyadobacter chenwenxiniae]|uniref:Nucleotidyltransferase family protein n=1 Tax=Dyadobacter chenwenxiniae TaxID=2906456 RepID=A0A9X1PJ01_9BACT|nr:nucleotidyltransferase family protein [Dyadobacter chenwenxiniae]MCF0060854.1 nucleotidyltransferase family protein [Dyadobacter chenwenxiniae]UON80681.1 nucleotidyltransferase family protein [Dyadobacter chenwenxiniae]